MPPLSKRDARLRRQQTTRSLDADAAIAVATVSGDAVFNGAVVGVATDERPKPEESPLLRKCSLYNRLERPRRKVADSTYVDFYKRWRSLENVADVKGDRKPRLAIRSWLRGFFSGPPRSTASSLRRAPPLLDRESAV